MKIKDLELEFIDEEGNNIIHKLIENDDEKIKLKLNYILEKGELDNLINSKNYNGLTPLHCAIYNKNQKCAKLLIDYGANINIPTDYGEKITWIDNQKGGANKKKLLGKRYI